MSIATQISATLAELHSNQKFVHGNLDLGSVFIEADPSSGEMYVKVDLTEHHQLTKLLKKEAGQVATETSEARGSDGQMSMFQEFRKATKVTVQSDI